MEAELSHWNFAKVRKAAEEEWQKYLSLVKVTGTEDQKKNFYTSMYHLFVQPNNIADVDGRYRGPNDSIYTAATGKYYSTFSLWILIALHIPCIRFCARIRLPTW